MKNTTSNAIATPKAPKDKEIENEIESKPYSDEKISLMLCSL